MGSRQVSAAGANGISIAYRDSGTSGQPLVLINGFASTMDMWSPPFLAALARSFRTIVFDNRGTGYTPADATLFSIPRFAADTAALMDALGIPRAHVLGLSMGASVAQEFSLAYPGRVDRLILVSGTCGGNEAVGIPAEIWSRLTDKSGSPADLAARMFSLLFPEDWLAARDPWQYCPSVTETTSEENAARQAEAFFSWPGSYDRLPEIRCPVLVVTGAEDRIIPPENSRILAGRIPGARLAVIPGAGHGLQYQCPGVFARIVAGFLQA